ncbi:MAG: MBL fold metallo-hydrolase [Chloroflexi bacterium]|nr:MAG: MBL fold metallo-hydrolase [Chloroflexota bacterium]
MIREILPRLYRIRISLPRSPLKALNSYLIASPERFLLIDTGMNREECLRQMHRALKELNVDLRKTDLFITHWHIDHLGLVSALPTPSSRVYFNRPEARALLRSFEDTWKVFSRFAREHGFPPEELKQVFKVHPARCSPKEHPDFHLLGEGDELKIGDYSFVCLETPGHSPGHLCLYEPNKKILVAGDHLLASISPNIPLFSDQMNPLKEYLESLDKLYRLEVKLVLPGHGRIFRNHRRRIRELKHHHQVRAKEILHLLLTYGEQTAYQVASRMSWELNYRSWQEFPPSQKWFAFGEALSHLAYLEERGMVGRRKAERVLFYCK